LFISTSSLAFVFISFSFLSSLSYHLV
jgi:hypothetical protein